jgi:26S proteasome regulatory subunit N1
LAGEIAGDWTDMSGDDEELRAKLVGLASKIVPYNMAHNAEAEACDLLMEIERLDLLEQYVDESAYPRVCLYLTRQVIILRHFISLTFNIVAVLFEV